MTSHDLTHEIIARPELVTLVTYQPLNFFSQSSSATELVSGRRVTPNPFLTILPLVKILVSVSSISSFEIGRIYHPCHKLSFAVVIPRVFPCRSNVGHPLIHALIAPSVAKNGKRSDESFVPVVRIMLF